MDCSAVIWAQKEFNRIDLGDVRRNRRFVDVIAQMMQAPEYSLCRAHKDWGKIKGAYRLFESEQVTPEKILESHIQKTVERTSNEKIILSIQDTSYLNYTTRTKTKGLGFIKAHHAGRNPSKGLLMHTAMALSEAGEPLGILSQEIWARINQRIVYTEKERAENHNLSIEKKESFKWLSSLYQISIMPMKETTKVIQIADREGDIYEFIRDTLDMEESLIIRASHDRSINKRSKSSPTTEKLWSMLESKPIIGSLSVEVLNSKHECRRARLKVSVGTFQLPPPGNRTGPKHGDNLKMIPLSAVLVKEENPPRGEKPVEWVLLTDLNVSHKSEALQVVNWYTYRWNIEIFHKILKSGCSIEKCQLRSAAKLEKFIAMMSVVAWRLFWLSRINRIYPEAPCSELLSEHEWKLLFIQANEGKSLPTQPPTIVETVRWLAHLGGFIGRKSDGPPGIKSVWRGWMVLMESERVWRSINKYNCG